MIRNKNKKRKENKRKKEACQVRKYPPGRINNNNNTEENVLVAIFPRLSRQGKG